MTQSYILPDRLDTTAAPGLAEALRARMNAPIMLDGAGVESAGTLGLQVLIAAARQWEKDCCDYAIVNASDALLASCHTLGITPADIGYATAEAK
ncbi:STAS domain-containing protein [Rhodobacterales bacterium HKCCE4037]|nr:STAS domain-containing protein [Rhodobacterales bacterium HKCCE4037]